VITTTTNTPCVDLAPPHGVSMVHHQYPGEKYIDPSGPPILLVQRVMKG